MAEWQPLSVRKGQSSPDGPFEGMPPHLWIYVREWLESQLEPAEYTQAEPLGDAIALRLRIQRRDRLTAQSSILAVCAQDTDKALDVIDAVLYFTSGARSQALKGILGMGASVWTVSEDGQALLRRVSDEEIISYERAVDADDEISKELREAWAKTYGRNADPSDAWDHAIKAVELSMWPIVTPNNHKANLGTIAGQLGGQPERFIFRLGTSSTTTTAVEAVVQLLRLIWPNPDRHGTGHRRPPSQDEAQNVVQLAVTLVAWTRSGALSTTS
ncbi:MAG: hypothetical protein ACXVFZ_08790 [Blastococcus sp.]